MRFDYVNFVPKSINTAQLFCLELKYCYTELNVKLKIITLTAIFYDFVVQKFDVLQTEC